MSKLEPIGYGRTRPPKTSGSQVVQVVLLVGLLGLIFASLIPHSHSAREKAKQVLCASHLRELGQAMLLYANDNGGVAPADLPAVCATEKVALDRLICPSTPDADAPNQGSAPPTCSYIYLGAGVTNGGNANQVVALEDPANHRMEGANVLFADGHVEFDDLPTIQLLLNELNAGWNPPRTLTPSMSPAEADRDYKANWRNRMTQLKTGVWRIPATQPASEPQAGTAEGGRR